MRNLSLFLLALTIAPASAVAAEPSVGAGSMGLSFDLGGLALTGAPAAVSLSYFQSDRSAWLTEHLSLWGMTGLSLILDDDFRAVTGSSALHASIYF